MKNSPAFLEVAFAISHLGGIFLPINYRLSSAEVSYIAQNAGAQLLFVDAELEHLAADITARVVTVTPAMQRDMAPSHRNQWARRPGVSERTKRPLPADVHLGYDRPAERCAPLLRERVLEMPGPCHGPATKPERRSLYRRAALSRWRLRPAGYRCPLDGRHPNGDPRVLARNRTSNHRARSRHRHLDGPDH